MRRSIAFLALLCLTSGCASFSRWEDQATGDEVSADTFHRMSMEEIFVQDDDVTMPAPPSAVATVPSVAGTKYDPNAAPGAKSEPSAPAEAKPEAAAPAEMK